MSHNFCHMGRVGRIRQSSQCNRVRSCPYIFCSIRRNYVVPKGYLCLKCKTHLVLNIVSEPKFNRTRNCYPQVAPLTFSVERCRLARLGAPAALHLRSWTGGRHEPRVKGCCYESNDRDYVDFDRTMPHVGGMLRHQRLYKKTRSS